MTRFQIEKTESATIVHIVVLKIEIAVTITRIV